MRADDAVVVLRTVTTITTFCQVTRNGNSSMFVLSVTVTVYDIFTVNICMTLTLSFNNVPTFNVNTSIESQ